MSTLPISASARRAAHRPGTLTPQMDAVVICAVSWWKAQRPAGWTSKQHRANPTAHTTEEWSEADEDLARAVAAYLTNGPVEPTSVERLPK